MPGPPASVYLMLDLNPHFTAIRQAVEAEAMTHANELLIEQDRRAQAEQRAAAIQHEYDTFKANVPTGLPLLKPGEKPRAHTQYRVADGPVRFDVTEPGVTIFADHLWPNPAFEMAGIHARPGADGLTVVVRRWHWPDAPSPTGKLDIKPCVRVEARNVTVRDGVVEHVNGFVEILPGGDDTTILNCHEKSGLRSAFSYCGGGHRTAILRCSATDSYVENLIRWSPHNGAISEGGIVAWCDLANPGNKSVIDARHCRGIRIWKNKLRCSTNHAGVGIGDKSLKPGDVGAHDIVVEDNDIYGGCLIVWEGSDGVELKNNRIHWDVVGGNCPIVASGNAKNVRMVNNTGRGPAGVTKQFISFVAPEWDVKGNGWRTE